MKNGVHALIGGQARRIENFALRIVERRFAAPFAVPNGQLPGKIAKPAHGSNIESGHRGAPAQLQERRDSVAMQRAGRLRDLDDMGSGPAGELRRCHEVISRVAASSTT